MRYTNGNISIRKTTEADLDFVMQAESAKENAPYVAQWTREQHIKGLRDENLLHVVLQEDGKVFGYAIMDGLKDINRSLELKRLVVVDKGRGLGRSALKLFIKLAFEEVRVHRLWLDVRIYNDRARYLYKSIGFTEEGILRECVYYNGRHESIVIMSILEQEYKTLDLS